ncbi:MULTISPECIES: acyl-CoA dehydrogenase family protein [Kitasatospora]|uniref:Putative isobutylamine N-hydroxylase n=1 Tax=Kitasatospora setae (strain ATCC 33774 / DSM 43861 / JCM 3304 / KCC A-0304 / NBRC 14216 / KM-6054) TaxID=452652 RepID=E4NBH1_KITSK|nr:MULTISPECIES: acyl-CoA dehydrogenase family protein [Kitasatospora]BAJ28552.1 putative isobutylamine N-hydroxylase [Kitasatospora setae KM-6054]
MRSLDVAREVSERYHPGLAKALGELPYAEREAPGSPVIDLFRRHGGVGLLIPAEYGGLGADPLEAVRAQRALGALSPSLAAAVTMHHFTAAMLYALADGPGRLTAEQLELLHGVVPEQRLMASGWAEGRTQQNILTPAVTADRVPHGYRLNGSKKPCSLARSMDLLTASIAVPGDDGTPELALALVRADTPGLSVHPFWGNDVLAAAESDEVQLSAVFVPEELVIRTAADDPDRIEDLQNAGFAWFELLISAGYLGAASGLVEEVLRRDRGGVADRAELVLRTEAAAALLEGAARAVADGVSGEEAVAQVLVARYAVQRDLTAIADQALELLGGLDFIRSSDHSRTAIALRPLAFHPPSRAAAAGPLLSYLSGDPLVLS